MIPLQTKYCPTWKIAKPWVSTFFIQKQLSKSDIGFTKSKYSQNRFRPFFFLMLSSSIFCFVSNAFNLSQVLKGKFEVHAFTGRGNLINSHGCLLMRSVVNATIFLRIALLHMKTVSKEKIYQKRHFWTFLYLPEFVYGIINYNFIYKFCTNLILQGAFRFCSRFWIICLRINQIFWPLLFLKTFLYRFWT